MSAATGVAGSCCRWAALWVLLALSADAEAQLRTLCSPRVIMVAMFVGELAGRWWLLGREEHPVSGTLTSAWNERPRVSAIGLLEPASVEEAVRHMQPSFVQYPVVLGRGVDDKPVTLAGVRAVLRQVHLRTREDASIELLHARGREPQAVAHFRRRLQSWPGCGMCPGPSGPGGLLLHSSFPVAGLTSPGRLLGLRRRPRRRPGELVGSART